MEKLLWCSLPWLLIKELQYCRKKKGKGCLWLTGVRFKNPCISVLTFCVIISLKIIIHHEVQCSFLKSLVKTDASGGGAVFIHCPSESEETICAQTHCRSTNQRRAGPAVYRPVSCSTAATDQML